MSKTDLQTGTHAYSATQTRPAVRNVAIIDGTAPATTPAQLFDLAGSDLKGVVGAIEVQNPSDPNLLCLIFHTDAPFKAILRAQDGREISHPGQAGTITWWIKPIPGRISLFIEPSKELKHISGLVTYQQQPSSDVSQTLTGIADKKEQDTKELKSAKHPSHTSRS